MILKSNYMKKILTVYREDILPAKKLIWRLRRKYGKNVNFFLLMFAGTGDVYFAGMYLNSYAEQKGIKNKCMLVIGNACRKVAQLYPDIPAECITQKEATALSYYRVFSEDKRIHLVHYDTPIFRNELFINGKLRGYQGLNFLDIFLGCSFGDVNMLKKQEPCFNVKEAERFLTKQNINRKSIVMAPYAKSMLTLLPNWFWEQMATQLTTKGYRVYTNCAGEEKVIEGTEPIQFDFNIAKPVMDYCGIYIGLRSGLTDIISSSTCKKFVLYPSRLPKGVGNSLVCYSLVGLGLDPSAIEIEFDEKLMKDSDSQLLEIAAKIIEQC